MRREPVVLALVATLGLAAVAEAGIEEAGTTAANFLTLGSGARTLAMGGAILGLGEDVGSSAWNAAALGWVSGSQAALSHAGQAGGSQQEWGAYGGALGGRGTRWAVSGLYQGAGTIEGRDASGLATGNVSVGSVALGTTLAQQVGERLTLGVGSKYVHEKLGSASGGGFTFDVGLMLRQGGLGLGVAAQNLLGQMKYSGAVYQFPTNYGVGLAYSEPRLGLKVALDANLPRAYHPDVRAGVEWTYRGMAAFRTGYRKELGAAGDPLTGASFGLGAGHNGTWMDYGYLLSSDGSGEHRLGLRMQLGAASDAGHDEAAPRPREHDFESAKDNTLIGPPVPPSKQR
jgi:hypothetical protein